MNPVLHDLPLPLPANELFLKTLLVLAFVAHIIFVNLMLGGSILTLFFELKGLKNRAYDAVAFEIAKTITVNKSLAVVLGVAPLLLINVLYTVWFYSANILTGNAWISIIPLATLAFLLTYLHQYTWRRLEHRKTLHLMIMAAAVLIFLVIPLIFLTNINLMLFPGKWASVKGFGSALLFANVLPRYLHFLAASLALSSLCLVGWFARASMREKIAAAGLSPANLARDLYLYALCISVCQLVIGPLLLFTLPDQGLSMGVYASVGIGALVSLPAFFLMLKEVRATEPALGRRYAAIMVLLCLTVVLMATGRHLYREEALKESKAAMKAAAIDSSTASPPDRG